MSDREDDENDEPFGDLADRVRDDPDDHSGDADKDRGADPDPADAGQDIPHPESGGESDEPVSDFTEEPGPSADTFEGDDGGPIPSDVPTEGGPQDPSTRDRGPLGDLADRIGDRRESDSTDDPFAEAFEDVEVDEVDTEHLWEELEDGEFETAVDAPDRESDRDVHVVEKRMYCERCQYFSAPPETRCTYEGSDILQLEDTEHFRVADCPVVRGDATLRGRD